MKVTKTTTVEFEPFELMVILRDNGVLVFSTPSDIWKMEHETILRNLWKYYDDVSQLPKYSNGWRYVNNKPMECLYVMNVERSFFNGWLRKRAAGVADLMDGLYHWSLSALGSPFTRIERDEEKYPCV
jgi:hypothetical protein